MELKELLTIVLIGVLLVTVGIQTVQLISLGNAPVVATAGGAMAKAPSMGAGPSAGGGSSLNDLPSMVGGC